MSKYAPLTLRTIAAITSATSAAAAHPAAANLFGVLPGGVMVASSAAAIYAGWHLVATHENTDTRIVSGTLAGVFAAAMVAGIHSSVDLKTATLATGTAVEADALYTNQESTRMATLATVAAELRAISKREFPDQYNELQAQVKALSTPTARTPTATQTATPTSEGVYPWVVAGLLEVVSPALLLLAGMFGRKGNQGQPVGNSRATLTEEGQPQGNPCETQENQQFTDNEQDAIEADENEGQPVGNPLEALEARAVALDAEGNVTVNALVALTGCTPKQARTAFAKAAEQGILTKAGTGGATRYTYANKLRIVK
ncbi:hypothetical protein RCF98_14305 [Thiothrix lacustris]|uniref:Uncharacterized protein n=1 Tax=Thiothrix lacustris TaxID=525917 RepID=A0ABY9MPM1_9GAMM|nr:hypothetical protein [Thiothrix lacustris]WML90135.1 hypothetical protein RCF98_14305 [Thiothrix lacustris]